MTSLNSKSFPKRKEWKIKHIKNQTKKVFVLRVFTSSAHFLSHIPCLNFLCNGQCLLNKWITQAKKIQNWKIGMMTNELYWFFMCAFLFISICKNLRHKYKNILSSSILVYSDAKTIIHLYDKKWIVPESNLAKKKKTRWPSSALIFF